MSSDPRCEHHSTMNQYVLYHRHAAADCSASFAAWNGFHSELRRTPTRSTCPFGGHEIWWTIAAPTERDALALLPKYLADRTLPIRFADVDVP